jgi:holo-[acyl-carrier protein] synthase
LDGKLRIVGVGVDTVEVWRIEAAMQKHERFVKRLFTPSEEAYCRSRKKPHLHFAVRFSAKEATLKALGTGAKGVSWKDMEIVKDGSGKPGMKLVGSAAERAGSMKIEEILISLSFSKDNAVACAIAVGRDQY